MPAITAAMVGRLRAKTDAPMMECKRALTEADGNIDRAEEILRVRLGSKPCASRVTAEGVVAAFMEGNTGALVELNCETDFVAKNDDFLRFASSVAKLVATENPTDLNELNTLVFENKTVEQICRELIAKIGENISIRRFQRYAVNGKLAVYLHDKRIGVIVEYEGANEQVGKDLAMHIAAMKPIALSIEQVPVDLIEKERKVALKKAMESGKPDEIVTKIVDGSVDKFLKEVSLLNQTFVKSDKQSVEQMLKSTNTNVNAFTMFVVGEGIEKKQDNFAAEVAAQVAAARKL
ncbi:translation elongation factor Ts [Candidatus Pandoraea novymonadis]|uniref:Elongation factor Ts n=1 Tax=Candidatus Pandoraea novymonadis TaxID=1808959 RepID=A0ABX5FE92_9BURK|nr:translation elongation factor Ts [Candidatus Pandoraea novymonadis]PSB92034.1 Elongation factor Ts [Candidatus Pandoraea novymonadis]